MSDPYGPSSYGPSDRRYPPGDYDGPSHSHEARADDRPARHSSPDPGHARSSSRSGNAHSSTYPPSPRYSDADAQGAGYSDADAQYTGYSEDEYAPGAGYSPADEYAQGPDYSLATGNAEPPASGSANASGYPDGGGSFGPAADPGARPPGGRSSRLVMGGAAAAVVLVLIAAAAIFELHGRGGSTANPNNAALNQGAAATPSAAGNKAPAAANPSAATTAKPSPTKSAGKSSSTTTPPKSATGGGVPAPPAGFTLTFSDNFDGASGAGLSTSKYRYDTGPGSKFGTGEIETMTGSTRNVFHDGNGHLVLRALHSGNDAGSGWTSGRFETQSASFGAAKGGKVRMQASIEQPTVNKSNGAGYWPAFWMLGNGLRNGGTWPSIGEVDILEDVNGRSSVFGTLHCGVSPGGPCNESSGIGSGEHACAGCQTGFHTYAVEIDRSSSPERIRWFLDGKNYFTLTQDRVDATTWSNAVDHPFFVIFDLAMGGGFPAAFGGGPNNSTVSGGEMKVDYVAVYNSH
jgi:beta-glucanase (GH16 family)